MKRLIKTLMAGMTFLALLAFIGSISLWARSYLAAGNGSPVGEICYASPPQLYGQRWHYIWLRNTNIGFRQDIYLIEGPASSLTKPGLHAIDDLTTIGMIAQTQPDVGLGKKGALRVYLISQKASQFPLSMAIFFAAILPITTLIRLLGKMNKTSGLSMFDPSLHKPVYAMADKNPILSVTSVPRRDMDSCEDTNLSQ